ncbi:5'-nucleotidase domain-containing protein 1 isoform X2 [Festucalex cinctus]
MTEFFSLLDSDVIGFDLDHTLCRYHLKETSKLIYESFSRYLVEHKGYDKDLLTLTPATWDFCFKGLVVDLEDGNLVKLAEDGTVLRATHGTTDLSTEEIIKHYGPKREWKHFNSLNTSFARSEDAGTYFPNVKRDPGRYLQTCSESVKTWLHSMKNAGKVLLLITSSHSDYCRLICEHILGKDFEELFDVIITNALKPGFFSLKPQQRSFKNLVNDVEENEDMPSLDKPGWYSQGNWMHLHELLKTMTGKPEPKVVYFGDSMRSDMFPASSFGKWETVMIVEEMEGEGVPKSDAARSNEAQVEPQEKKGKFEASMKSPSTMSNQWGSYFVDVHRSGGEDEEIQKLTWCCHCIHKYSTMAIPSVEHIANLPLDYKFPRFSPDKPCTTGYFPRPPDSLLKRCKSLS